VVGFHPLKSRAVFVDVDTLGSDLGRPGAANVVYSATDRSPDGLAGLTSTTHLDGFASDDGGRSAILLIFGAIGLVVVAGPDAGEVSYRIDDGAWQALDVGTRHKGIHLPRLHVLFDELDPSKQHTLMVKLNPSDKPTACRIAYVAVNGE